MVLLTFLTVIDVLRISRVLKNILHREAKENTHFFEWIYLPAATVRVILLPAEFFGRKLNHTDSLCRKLFTKYNSLGRKQEIADSLGGSQI